MEHCQVQSLLNNDECLISPGFDTVRDDSVGPPPGFESLGTLNPSKKVPRRKHQPMDRRVTRSQKKLAKIVAKTHQRSSSN